MYSDAFRCVCVVAAGARAGRPRISNTADAARIMETRRCAEWLHHAGLAQPRYVFPG